MPGHDFTKSYRPPFHDFDIPYRDRQRLFGKILWYLMSACRLFFIENSWDTYSQQEKYVNSPIQYRLIKKKSTQVPVWEKIITPTEPSNTYVYTGRYSGYGRDQSQKNSSKWARRYRMPCAPPSGCGRVTRLNCPWVACTVHELGPAYSDG